MIVYYMMARLHCMSKAFIGIVQDFGEQEDRKTGRLAISQQHYSHTHFYLHNFMQ